MQPPEDVTFRVLPSVARASHVGTNVTTSQAVASSSGSANSSQTFLVRTKASPLTCWTYETYFKSEAGKVSIPGGAVTCDGAPSTSYRPCLYTCDADVVSCFNEYVESGYDTNGNLGGGSANYGKEVGGCWVQALGQENCTTNLDGDNRISCCSTDKCNTEPEAGGGGADLFTCFAKESTKACRLTTASTNATSAFEACYAAHLSSTAPQSAKLVLLATLSVGDRVLTMDEAGALAVTRVVVNQHASSADATASLLSVRTAEGTSLSLTPDHAIFVDGTLAAASTILVGARLRSADGTVAVAKIITRRAAAVVNPVTVAGTILVSDEGAPVLAASHPIGVASIVLRSSVARTAANAALSVAGTTIDYRTPLQLVVVVVAKVAAAVVLGTLGAKACNLRKVKC